MGSTRATGLALPLDRTGLSLRSRLLDVIDHGDSPGGLTDEAFDTLARAVFAWQYEWNSPFAAWCRRRDRTPQQVSHWTEIPPVPVAAFREVALVAGSVEAADAVFRTSGTTSGSQHRGVHYVPDLSIYDASLLAGFRAALIPDGTRLRMFSLLPMAAEMPDSSLAHMIGSVMTRFGAQGSRSFASIRSGIDPVALATALHAATEDRAPVCLLGTSFSFVHWLDELVATGTRFTLPEGSRLMDTGGFKGRSREVDEETLRSLYAERLGIAPNACVNEYGMTEMCSQFYDTTLREPDAPRRKRGPAWLRTRIVDPDTLRPVGDDRNGLLQHFDLANIGSVLCVQTEDLGRRVGDGFHVLGRAQGATPRGCSIAMDELLAAVRAPR